MTKKLAIQNVWMYNDMKCTRYISIHIIFQHILAQGITGQSAFFHSNKWFRTCSKCANNLKQRSLVAKSSSRTIFLSDSVNLEGWCHVRLVVYPVFIPLSTGFFSISLVVSRISEPSTVSSQDSSVSLLDCNGIFQGTLSWQWKLKRQSSWDTSCSVGTSG